MHKNRDKPTSLTTRSGYEFGKRTLDIAGSLLGLIIALPLIIGAAAAVYLSMRRPLFFRQIRVGKDARPFTVVKLRTMREAVGDSVPDEERLNRVGRFLRRFSLDELPELWNVLKGEMSLVGPRPLLPDYLPLYTVRQAGRHEVRPGLTGWAQVNGRNALTWDQKFELDVWYVDHRALMLDLRILVMTMRQVLAGHGVSAISEEIMPRFTGSSNSATTACERAGPG